MTHGFYDNNGENQKELEQLIKTALSWATEQYDIDRAMAEAELNPYTF